LYNAITATENDPFYQDYRIPNFIELIVDIWIKISIILEYEKSLYHILFVR
jgi:hypothetical protein